MATIQELVATITDDGRQQVQRYDEQTRAQIARYTMETDALLAKEHERLDAQAQRQTQEGIARMEAKRQLAAMQATLKCRQELLDETFAAASKQLSGAQRTALLNRLWQRACGQIKVSSVLAAKQDVGFFRSKGVAVRTQEGTGGFIAQSSDGKVRVDMRFETLLADVRARATAEITSVLFKGDEKKTPKQKAKVRR